jgi:molybdate transport system regulatory protein
MFFDIQRRMRETDNNQQAAYRARGRVWIEGPDGTFLGYGRVVLLERIRDHGSISAAARSMEMSYRRAWNLVDSMNRQSRTPVVTMSTGGRGGGGASLTEAGEHAIETFWSFWDAFKDFLGSRTRTLDL